jgi:hypothetical protein
MPLLPPVMTATFPSRVFISMSSCSFVVAVFLIA